jgi:hypothetical protein
MDVVNAERFASLRVLVLDNKYSISQSFSPFLFFSLFISLAPSFRISILAAVENSSFSC